MPTPPPPTHFDADAEIRTRGTGFYKFSKDEDVRAEEMRALHVSREETDLQRRQREEAKANEQADDFLNRLFAEGVEAGGGGTSGEEKSREQGDV